MTSCYNVGFGGQRFPNNTRSPPPPPQQPKQLISNVNNTSPMSSQYGNNAAGPSGFNSAGYGGGSGAIGGGHGTQFLRQQQQQSTAPPMMGNNNFNSTMGDFGLNRYPPTNFYSKFSLMGHGITTSPASSSCAATPSPPPIIHASNSMGGFFDSNFAAQLSSSSIPGGNVFSGIGTIVWLSWDRGLIEKLADGENETTNEAAAASGARSSSSRGVNNNDDNNNRSNENSVNNSKSSSPSNVGNNLQISFVIKDFCDQAVTDLTSVLRIGFLVKFQAVADYSSLLPNNGLGSKFHHQQQRVVANFVSPLPLTDWTNVSLSTIAAVKKLSLQLDTPSSEPLPCDDLTRRRNPYDLDLELRATKLLMNIYGEQPSQGPQCPLSTFHCIVSNCGDDQMYRYIGTSSQKRRHFVERRRHFFAFTPDDTVCLVPAAVYTAVTALSRELLQRGGAMKLQELFTQYLTWPDLPLEAREIVGETKLSFMQFLESHPFVFAVFPSRVFVGLHRRLPDFDYGSFLEECFGDQEGSPYFGQCQQTNSASGGNVTNLGPSGAGGGYGQVGQQQQQQQHPMGNRWGSGDERSGPFGNGIGGGQGAPHGRHLISPPVYLQPTPPGHPSSVVPRFAQSTSSNYNAFNVPPPPPFGPRSGVAGYGMGNWPPPSHGPSSNSNVDEAMANQSVMTNSSIGGSNLSLSSGYSTGPTPSTPGPGIQGQQFWPSRGPMPAPENVAGFWKSYELGTETLIRQLNSSNEQKQNRIVGGQRQRTTPTPPPLSSMLVYGTTTIQEQQQQQSLGGSRGSRMTTPENLFLRPPSSASSSNSCKGGAGMSTNDTAAQTERFLLALRCGHCGIDNEWLFPLLNSFGIQGSGLTLKAKADTVEAAVQTEDETDLLAKLGI